MSVMVGTAKAKTYACLTTLLIILLFLGLTASVPESCVQAESSFEERNFVKYEIEECTDLALNNTLSLSFYSVLFANSSPYQEVRLINSSPPVTELVTDACGNTIARIFFPDLRGQQELRIVFTFEVTARALQHSLSEDVGVYDPSSDLFKTYTLNETHVEAANPEIVQKAQEIVGTETNAYRAARSISRWVHDNIKYEVHPEDVGALWTLENRKGDCGEFSFLFTALCRAVGIPARVMVGFASPKLLDGGFFPDSESMGTHQWAEVYFPKYGWVWVDPTWDQFAGTDAMHLPYLHTEFAQYEYRNQIFQTRWIGWHYEGYGVSFLNRTYSITVSNMDSDLDGLTNAEEAKKGTNGFRQDTDYDLWGDKIDPWPTDFFLPNMLLFIVITPAVLLIVSWLKRRRNIVRFTYRAGGEVQRLSRTRLISRRSK